MRSYVLFAHGARDPAWAAPLDKLQAAIERNDPGANIRQAFLEFMTPDLNTAIDQLTNEGALEIHVVPVFLSQGGHVKRDLPTMIERARQSHPQVRILLRGVVGEDASVIEAMAKSIVPMP